MYVPFTLLAWIKKENSKSRLFLQVKRMLAFSFAQYVSVLANLTRKVPSVDVEKKWRSKDKADTQLSGVEPGVPSLLQVIQSRTKKFCSKPIQHTPFNPEPVSSSTYGAAAVEEQ